MKALSIMEPWASLIILGAKRYETRSWRTAHRGPLLIHASAKLPPAAQGICYQEPFKTALAPLLLPYAEYQAPDGNPWDLPRGCLLGIVEVVECVPVEDVAASLLTPEEKAFGDYRPGRWAWHMAVVQRFETPIPIPGHLGLWDVPADLLPPMGAFGIHKDSARTH